ncbi:hypothetical protein KAI12_01480, partial [Candidatus Bathyarchaeota archaeon]|nr:hypothetical protein [Candidatus Bathyarchaeota archaeon]
MVSSNNPVNPTHVKGWIFDVYPSAFGEITIWIIGENGERFRLIDKFHPKIYVSGRAEDIERLASQFFSSKLIESWNFVYKYARTTDNEKRKVLEIELRDCRKISVITRNVLKMGDYSLYEVHNCNLHGDQHYLFTHDLFPLALVEVETERTGLRYTLRDSVESVNYVIPPLRITKLHVEVAKRKKIAKLNEPISQIVLTQDNTQEMITHGEEGDKLLQLVKLIKRLDPDIILTSGGDAHLFPYLIHRAKINNVLNELIINRENRSLAPRRLCGRTFFSYGRTYYRAPTTRLFGRVHIDERNTFTLRDCGFEGLIEIARICRTPLHTASRSSIGSSMSALQFYQAIKDEVLIPRNKSIPEAFKSAYELLVGDRGGFIYEPQVGIHDWVSEVDFASMYPSLMAKNNISAETVLCKCCIESPLRIPELNYNICKRRVGIVPKTLKFVIGKRLLYKCLKEKTRDSSLKEVYNRRQTALKWILVTCFGYLGYRNAK